MYAQKSGGRRGRDADLFAGLATAGAEDSEAAGSTIAAVVSATVGASPHGPALTGERNESSVLFSLATLAKQTPAAFAAKVTESSALIDLRALVSASAIGDGSRSRADDIVNLSGGGAFAPLFAPPLAPPVTFVPTQEEARGRPAPLMIAATVLAVVTVLGAATFAGVRSRTGVATTAVSAVGNVVSSVASEPSPSNLVAAVPPGRANSVDTSIPAVPARSASRTTATVATSIATATTSTVSKASTVGTASTASAVGTASTQTASPKCCPGESDTACHMRLSVGAACGGEPVGSPVTSATPFDRPAAARALGINVTSCKRADGPTGSGHVKVTFQPSGSVSAVDVEPPYSGTATGACVAQRYRGASVPAFSGGQLSVGKSFSIE